MSNSLMSSVARGALSVSQYMHLAKGGKAENDMPDDEKDKDQAIAPEDDGDKKDGKKGSSTDKDDEPQPQDEPSETDGKKGKRAETGDDDEDDSDEEMRGKSAAADARRRERARCAAIFSTRAAGRHPDVAAHFAFNTTMSRAEAISALEAMRASPNRDGRSSSNPALGASAPIRDAQAPSNGWQRAIDKVCGSGRTQNRR